MNDDSKHELGEFASFDLVEDAHSGKFTIVLKGDLRYGNMIAAKLGDLSFSIDEIEEWANESDEKTR